jgi:hypothetical protein
MLELRSSGDRGSVDQFALRWRPGLDLFAVFADADS